MPATEQTWRNLKTMHVVFAVNGVVLLIATLWMFAADHAREWKKYQLKYREIEQVYNQLRQQRFQVADAVGKRDKLQNDLLIARSAPVSPQAIADIKAELERDANHRSTVRGRTIKPPSVAHIGTMVDNLAEQVSVISNSQGDEQTRLREKAATLRDRIVDALNAIIVKARFREDRDLRTRKAKLSRYDKVKADLGLMVRDDATSAQMEAQQDKIRKVKLQVDAITQSYQHASAHRLELEKIVKSITDEIADVDKSIQDNAKALKQLQTAFVDRRATYFTAGFPFLGKKWLELPILDAFNSPLSIDNLWSKGLVQNYNFQDVRRFDRCTTCHRGIEKSLPGQATKPGYPAARLITLRVPTPRLPSVAQKGSASSVSETDQQAIDRELAAGDGLDAATKVEKYFGIKIAEKGVIKAADVLVSYVRPKSRAAQAEFESSSAAQKIPGHELRNRQLQTQGKTGHDELPGIMVGDVITQINGDDVTRSARTTVKLADAIGSDQGFITVQVRRGMPHPYASHPRLDLFVGSLSPHKVSDFACTICHEGQGSATAFKWASHSPNSEVQRKDWMRQYGWFDNHHWIYPQLPKRFIEATCLKCHHNVTELEPSKRFPDAPAPKVTRGYHLVRKFGCFGCHEINGYDGPNKRVGPDLRLEPNYFAAALQLKTVKGYDKLTADEKKLVETVIHHPEKNATRRKLYSVLLADGAAKAPRLGTAAHNKLAPLLKDVEASGKLRKVGPSLRYLGKKVDRKFLLDWLTDPQHFRPGTRMPKFFGMFNHMSDVSKDDAKQYEAIEVLAASTYLLAKSQSFAFAKRPSGITKSSAKEKADRGKILFQTKGCLACHSHNDFKDVAKYRGKNELVQGPDLSAIGSKFDPTRNKNARDWLYTWIQNPSKYHVRTKMPDLILKPIEEKDKDGKVVKVTDPVEDIAEYLLTSKSGWQPANVLSTIDTSHQEAFDKLALENLSNVFYTTQAKDHLKRGIPERNRKELKGAEVELIVPDADFDKQQPISTETKLLYLGRRTIAKYGCYACHDIPGFEDAKPIGTTLADWGRKEPAKLAFEHITHYLHGQHGGDDKDGHAGEHNGHSHAGSPKTPEFYLHQIESGHRAGFIYQKLVEPRSYDYHKTENKTYSEWLRMPQFPFDDDMREAIITFVLGLVAEPPAASKYLYKPSPRQKAIIQGKQVLAKYNCAGCHMLEPQRMELTFKPEAFEKQARGPRFPIAVHNFVRDELTASGTADHRNRMKATIFGMPLIVDADGLPQLLAKPGPDEDPEPVVNEDSYDPQNLVYSVQLWKPAALGGHGYQVGEAPLLVPRSMVTKRADTEGGTLAKYLLPHALALEKKANPQAKGSEVWGWLPPPLVGEGDKVQTNWLFSFLLDPHEIRPATILRMPKFNMSENEATRLVNYFAAVDGAQFPYSFNPRQRSPHLMAAEQRYQARIKSLAESAKNKSGRLGSALNIVTGVCIQCHKVSDFDPKGRDAAKAPNLASIYQRLRPDYLHRWVGKPKSILPYTSMPDNIAYDPTKPNQGTAIKQQLFPGNSTQQLDGLVDLLMNYDAYTGDKFLVAPLVKPVKPPTTTPTTTTPTTTPPPTTTGGN